MPPTSVLAGRATLPCVPGTGSPREVGSPRSGVVGYPWVVRFTTVRRSLNQSSRPGQARLPRVARAQITTFQPAVTSVSHPGDAGDDGRKY